MHVAPACLDTDVARVPKQKEGQQLAAFPSRRGFLGNSRDVTGSLDITLEQGGIKVPMRSCTKPPSELHR